MSERRNRLPAPTFSSGSKGSATPRSNAVPGISCIKPIAPDRLTAERKAILDSLEAQEGNWDELDLMVRAFQKATMALRYSGVPVVVATGNPSHLSRYVTAADWNTIPP